MIAAVGVEDRSAIPQGFTVYLQGLTGDKMLAFYGETAEQANEEARAIHSVAVDWMSRSSSAAGRGVVRLKLVEGNNGPA